MKHRSGQEHAHTPGDRDPAIEVTLEKGVTVAHFEIRAFRDGWIWLDGDRGRVHLLRSYRAALGLRRQLDYEIAHLIDRGWTPSDD